MTEQMWSGVYDMYLLVLEVTVCYLGHIKNLIDRLLPSLNAMFQFCDKHISLLHSSSVHILLSFICTHFVAFIDKTHQISHF